MNRGYYFTPRTDIIAMVPVDVKRVLDVGCGGGATGRVLKEKGVEEIVGVEINTEVAEFAKKDYDMVLVGDVEKIELPFPPLYFDCIIYGDVLEHLLDPWSLLRKHNNYVRSGGIIVVSVPNVRHYRILKKLVFSGRWDYVEEGILDRTHLRFFTLRNALEMIQQGGYQIREVKSRISAAKWLRMLNTMLKGGLSDFLVKQYIISGLKKGVE